MAGGAWIGPHRWPAEEVKLPSARGASGPPASKGATEVTSPAVSGWSELLAGQGGRVALHVCRKGLWERQLAGSGWV